MTNFGVYCFVGCPWSVFRSKINHIRITMDMPTVGKTAFISSEGKPLLQPAGCCEAIFFVTLRVTITSFLPFPFSCSINRKRGQRAASYQNNRSTFPINLWHLYSRWDGVGEAGRQSTKAHSIRPGSVHPDREREAGKYYNNKRPHSRTLPTTTFNLLTTPSPSLNRRNRHRTCRRTFCG